MNRLKRLTALILSLVIMSLPLGAFAYSDVASTGEMAEAIYRLNDLGIISGYQDGTFRAGNHLTRAEFARMMVSALGKDKEAKALGNTSVFSDVPRGMWATPYINYVAKTDIVSGYADGTYKPNQNISFAECVTILLRSLNYMEDKVGYFWPTNYTEAAKTEGISAGMSYGPYDIITRGDAALMIDRAIFSEYSDDDKILLENSGYKVIRDTVVIENSQGGIRLSDSNTYTGKLSLGVTKGQWADYAVIDKNGYLVALSSKTEAENVAKASMPVYVNAVTGNTVSYISNKIAGSYTFSGGFTVYADGVKMTYSQASGILKAGCDLTFYGDTYGVWNFAVIDSLGQSPYLASRDYTEMDTSFEGISLNKDTLTVYRGGEKASLSEIRKNDIVYFNPSTNVMDAYTKKVTGIYYDAKPSKTFVETVTVAGKDYTVGSDKAALMLGANAGSYEIGERVTLLLGKNDEVQFAVELSDAAVSNYGVVLSSGTQTNEKGATENYADIFMSDGETHRITVKSDASNHIGKLVKLNYNGSVATLSQEKKSSGLSGTLDKTARTLSGKKILKDAVIIQRTAYDEQKSAECKLLNLSTMTAKTISEDQILSAVFANGFGDIALLYLENVETTASFGVVSGIKGTNYEIFSDGTEKTYSASFSVSGLSVGTPVEFSGSTASLTSLKKLYKTANGKIQVVDESRIMIGGTVYELSPDVKVVDVSNLGEYREVSMESLKDGSFSSCIIYSDTSKTQGSVIRIITVQ